VFNPLPVARKDFVTIRVFSNEIKLTMLNGYQDDPTNITYSLVPTEPKSSTNDVRYFDLMFAVDL